MQQNNYDDDPCITWAISSVPRCVAHGIKQISLDNGWTHAVTLTQLLLAFESMDEENSDD